MLLFGRIFLFLMFFVYWCSFFIYYFILKQNFRLVCRSIDDGKMKKNLLINEKLFKHLKILSAQHLKNIIKQIAAIIFEFCFINHVLHFG